MDSVIQATLDNNLGDLQTYFDIKVEECISARIESAKIDVLAKINGVERSAMEEILNVSKE